jgi:hypothetical protein
MKSLLNQLLALSGIVLLILSSSCKKNDTMITATNGTPGVLSASATTLVLNNTKLTDPTIVETLTLVQPNFGYNAAIANTLQIDAPSDNWANPYTISMSPDVFTLGFNTNDFNNALLKAGMKGNVTGTVNMRVKSSIGATTFVYSNVLALTVTPFNLKSWLYVVGNFNNYSTSTPDSILSATGNGIYTGIIKFTSAGNRFLVLPAKNYNNKYATVTNPPVPNTGTSITYATEYVTGGGNDLYAPSVPGNYLITLNTNSNTVTVAAVDYFSIIGDAAIDWNTDVPMKYINDGNGGWSATLPLVLSGQFKIREDNDWTWSWGIPKAAGNDGFGVPNTLNDNTNNNIPVPVNGTYVMTFFTPITLYNGSSPTAPASTTATYSLIKQ